MSMETMLAGVAPVDFFDANHNLFMTAMALTDAGLNVVVSEDVNRAGFSNARLGSYFYDSNLALTLTSATFMPEFLATKLGSTIESGGDVFNIETVTTTVADSITVSEFTPVAPFADSTVKYGWYKLQNSDTWNTITFTGSTAPAVGLASGSTVCVKYAYTDASAVRFKINSEIIPDVVYAVMKIPELKVGTAKESYVSSSKVAETLVKIPKFQFDPNTDIALTSSGHATIPLSGNALINYDASCATGGYYAELVRQVYGKDEYADVKSIVVGDSDIDLTVDDTVTIEILKRFVTNILPAPIKNTNLTFVSSTPATATISSAGLITALAVGVTTIDISVTAHPTFTATATVTVTA